MVEAQNDPCSTTRAGRREKFPFYSQNLSGLSRNPWTFSFDGLEGEPVRQRSYRAERFGGQLPRTTRPEDRRAVRYAVYTQSHVRACLAEPRRGSVLAFANFDEIIFADNGSKPAKNSHTVLVYALVSAPDHDGSKSLTASMRCNPIT